MGTGIEVGYVLATKLCKLDIKGYGLVELGGEVGMKIEEPIFAEFQDLNVRDFSKEQTKYVVHNAYTSYAIVESCIVGIDSSFYATCMRFVY